MNRKDLEDAKTIYRSILACGGIGILSDKTINTSLDCINALLADMERSRMRSPMHVCIDGKLYPLENEYRWLAQDADGEWYSYLNKPTCESDSIWFNEFPELEVCDLICTTLPPREWREQLYELSYPIE